MMSSAVWLFVSGFISLNMCLFSVARWTGSRRNKHLNSDRKRFIIFWKPQESCCLSSLFGTQVHLDVSELRHTKSRLIPESSLRIQFHFELSASNVPAPKRLSYRHNYTTNLHQNVLKTTRPLFCFCWVIPNVHTQTNLDFSITGNGVFYFAFNIWVKHQITSQTARKEVDRGPERSTD